MRPDFSKIKQEPPDPVTRELADCAHDFCRTINRFDGVAAKCAFRIEGLCTRLANIWRCSLLNCPYCAPIFMLYHEEKKLND